MITDIEQAIIDGADVINLSIGDLGAGKPSYEDLVAAAAFVAMEKGIVVVAATGSYGPSLETLNKKFPWVLTATTTT